MKRLLFILICINSFSVFASKYDTMYGQMIDGKGVAYGFDQIIVVNKGEAKELTVAGLYNGFYSPMVCKVEIIDFCSGPTHTLIKSAFIITSNIGQNINDSQVNYQCGLGGGGCKLINYNNNEPVNYCNNNQLNLPAIKFQKVVNGSSFTITNRPEFNIQFTCTAD